MGGQTARGELLVGRLPGKADDNEGVRRGGGVAAEPCGIGHADGRGKAEGRAEDFDRALLAVVADNDADVWALLDGKCIADGGGRADQVFPAELFA